MLPLFLNYHLNYEINLLVPQSLTDCFQIPELLSPFQFGIAHILFFQLNAAST